jgi:putative protease
MSDLESATPGEDRYRLEMAFSRGLHTGWFEGINNQELVHARFGKKRGAYLGEVTRIRNEQITVQLRAPLKPGDGVVFDSGHPEASEEGGRIYTIEHHGQDAILAFGRGALNFKRIHLGDRIWKTSDPDLDRQIRQTFAGDTPQFQRPIDLEIHGDVGQSLVVIGRDRIGHVVQVESETPLVEALNKPLTSDRLQEQLGRLGNTPFRLEKLTNHLNGSAMLPVSELNRIRREIVTQLETLRAEPKRWQINSDATLSELLPNVPHRTVSAPSLLVLVRSLSQLRAALETDIQTLYCEFEDPRAYKQAVQMVRESGDKKIWVAPPRITKSGENWILQQVRDSQADGYLVRNYDQLQFFKSDRCIGDFSLNVANALTADYLIQTFGLERVTASYDLNISQLQDLLTSGSPDWYEVTIHQHMPMFHMEHCVFCAFMSDGTDYTNCGRPCEKHEVKLRDRVGTEHILTVDAGCRNTVFNGKAQTGAEYLQSLAKLGVNHFRIEFVNESAEQVKHTIKCYQELLKGEINGSQLWRSLNLQNQLGVTRGTF